MTRLLAGLAVVLTATLAAADEPGGAPPGVPVRVAPVEARQVEAGRVFVGTVEPARRTVLGSEFEGLVVEYLVREGDRVTEGQEVAKLRTRLVDLRIEVEKARLKLAGEALRELENGSRPEEIRQARARLEQLEAAVVLRQWQLDAAERLFKDKTISEDERREASLAYDAAQLLRDAQKAALDLVEAGPREEKIEQARAEIAIREAVIAELEEQRDRYVIRAPFDGWVVREHTEVGQWLASGAPVAEVIYLQEVDVVVPVVEDVAPRLRAGEDVRVAFDAYPERIFTGPIRRVVPQADLRGRAFPVLVRLQNPIVDEEPLLRAGMFAEATFSVGSEETGLFVPKDAIVLGGPQPMIWVVDPETSVATPMPVTLGIAVDESVQVVGKIEPGTPVVIRGNERLFPPAAPVTILPE